MMRDISARFKYSERADAKGSADAGSSSGSDAENKPPSGSVSPVNGARPTAPSRELIQEHLRRYYRSVEGEAAAGAVTDASSDATDWQAVSTRLQSDLAPYEVLKLGGLSLGDRCAQLLGDVLRANCTLRTLDLGFNRISDKGAALLATALVANKSLESLYLSGNEISPVGAEALAQALTSNSTLKSLHLSGNNVGEEGARSLANGLARNTSLRSLYLGTNGIGASGMQALAAALQQNSSLEELTLGQNRIGSAGLKHLAEAFLSGSVCLTTLEIGKNNIDHDGALALAKALCGATNTLQNLYFDNNPLGDVGASAFGAFLAKNAVVRVLDLSYTQMSLLGLRELSMGLAHSSSLLCLLLDGHDWASTQFMKKSSGLASSQLQGVTLSTKGANNYAASCIVGAIHANPKSALFKLTGVDLGLVVAVPSSPSSSSSSLSSSGDQTPSTNPTPSSSAGTRRYSDALSRNERVLKFLHESKPQAAASSKNKRKTTDDGDQASTDSDAAASSSSSSTATGPSASTSASTADDETQQHLKFQKLSGNLKASSSSGSLGSNTGSGNALLGLLPPPPHPATPVVASSTSSTAGGSSSPKTSSNRPPRVIRIPSRGSLGHLSAMSGAGPAPEKRLSLKSPRYESTMEVHVRKVVADIAQLPFSSEELATLRAFYLGQQGSGDAGCSCPVSANSQADDDVALSAVCSSCRASRLAKYPRAMVRPLLSD